MFRDMGVTNTDPYGQEDRSRTRIQGPSITHSNSHRSLGDPRDLRSVRDAQDLQVGGDSLSHTMYVKNNSS